MLPYLNFFNLFCSFFSSKWIMFKLLICVWVHRFCLLWSSLPCIRLWLFSSAIVFFCFFCTFLIFSCPFLKFSLCSWVFTGPQWEPFFKELFLILFKINPMIPFYWGQSLVIYLIFLFRIFAHFFCFLTSVLLPVHWIRRATTSFHGWLHVGKDPWPPEWLC